MQRTMSYSVGGRVFDLPSDKVEGFLETAKANGDAPEEAYSYRVSGKDGVSREFTIPRSKFDGFRQTAEANGDRIEPLHSVSMDDGATLNLSQEAVRQFVQARQTGMPMSRTLLANTGIPDIYAHSRAEREALADKFALMFPPEEPRQDYLPRERNLGDTISEGIDALRTSPTVAGAVGAVKGFVEGAVTNAGEAIDDFYGDSILGNALKGAGDFSNAATKSILHTAATAIGGRDTEWGRALLSASESIRTDSANMETGNETANAILGFAKDFNQNTLPTIAKLAVPGVAAVDIAGSVVDGYYDAYNEAIRNGASPDKANALASAKAGIAAAEGLWLAKSAGSKEAINGIKGIIAGSLRMGGKMAVTGAAGDVVQQGVEGADNPDLVRAGKSGLKSGAEGALFDITAKGLHAVAGAGDRKAASEARRAAQERNEAAAKETAREEARTRYEANLSDEAVADIDATIAKQVEAGTIPSWRHADEVKRKAIEKLGGRENGESHEAVEQSIIEAAGEVNERLNTPDRVESAALERRKAEYEQKMAAYEEARAKREAEKKRFGRAKTELPEKPTPPELRVEKPKKTVVEADLSKKTAQVDKGTPENAEIVATKAENAAENVQPTKVPDGRGRMVEKTSWRTSKVDEVDADGKPLTESDKMQLRKDKAMTFIDETFKDSSRKNLENAIMAFDDIESEGGFGKDSAGASPVSSVRRVAHQIATSKFATQEEVARFKEYYEGKPQPSQPLENAPSRAPQEKGTTSQANGAEGVEARNDAYDGGVVRGKSFEDKGRVRKRIRNSQQREVSVNGEKVKVGRDFANEYTHSGYSSFLQVSSRKEKNAEVKKFAKEAWSAKVGASADMQNLMSSAKNERFTKFEDFKDTPGHEKDASKWGGGMYEYDVSFSAKDAEGKDRNWKARAIVRVDKEGVRHLYDVVDLNDGSVIANKLIEQKAKTKISNPNTQMRKTIGVADDGSVAKTQNPVKATVRVPDGRGRMVKKAENTAPTAKSEGGQKRTAATSDELKPLKDAIAEAKKITVEKPRFGTSTPTKTFEAKVGTTTIKFGNTEEGIAAAEKMAKKLSVVKDWMPKEPSNKTPAAPKPLKVASGKNVGTFNDVAPDFFAGKKDWRSELKAPIVKDGYIYATDGHTLIRMKADIEAKNTDGATDVKKVFEMAVGSPTEKFKIDASTESIPLEQARAATNKDYNGVEIWRSPEGKIVMRAKTAEDTSESSAAFINTSSLKNHDFIGKFDPDYIEKAFKTFAKLGVKDVDVEWKDPTKALYLRGGGAEVLVMPMHGGILEADAKVQMLGGRRRMTDSQRAEIVDQQVADAIAKAKEKDPKLTQKRINEIEEQIRDSEKLAQEEIGKHNGNLDPMLSPDKPLGERIVDSAAELDRLIADEESSAPSAPSTEGLPSRSYSWQSGSGVGGLFPRLVSKNSIVRKMKELFPEFAIRGENTTKIGASYAGHFEPWRELIRSKDMASIDTIPHEIGHGISMRTKRKAMNIPQEAKRELAKFGRQLYGNKKPTGGYMEEGFAEYVRGYMTGAENLATEAPALDRWFNNTFAKTNPEYVEKMRQIRLEVQRYRQQSDIQKVAAFMKPDSGRISRTVEAVKSFFSAENWNDTNATLTRGINDSGMSRMFEWRKEFRDLEKAVKEGRTADADALRKSIDEKIASDPRIFASNSRGTSKSRVMDAFENGVTDIEGFGKIGNVVGWNKDGTPIRDNNTESVRDIFRSFSRKELADWDKYAIAKVGLENYINEGREFGLDRSVCENIVRDLESPKFEDALKRFTDFTRRGVSVGLESGAMSKSDYEAMTGAHKYYVRIERRLAPDGAGLGGAQQNPFHKIKGSSKNILNPRAATMIQMERQIRFFQAAKLLNLIGKATLRAEKANADFAKGVGNEEYQVAAKMPLRVANAQEAVNFTSEKLKDDFKKRASQAFEDNGQAQPGVVTTRRGKLMTEAQSMALDLYDSMYGEDGSKLTIFREKPSNGKNGLVSTYIDGKLVTFELPDARWTKFVTGMDNDALFNSKGAQTAWKIATAPSRTLKLGATLINTAFTMANVTRDTQHAAVTSESRQIPVVNIAQGLYDILYSKKTSALFKQMGGEAALFIGSSKERKYENAAKKASANTLLKRIDASPYNVFHAVTGAISNILSVPEMAPRVREMAGVMKKAQDAGLSYETAARLGFAAAKEVSLDFGKHGQYMRYLNDVMPYTNAWYRGLEQLSRKLGITEELPTSFEERRGVKAKNTVGKGLLFLTLPAIATTIAKMAMSDDEEREAIFKKTPREKWDFDDSLGVRLAQPFELGSIFHAMPKAMVYEAYGDKGAVKEALWHGIESNVLRFKDPADFARGMSLISPWLDIAMNEKWDDSPIVSPFIKESMPKSQWKDYSTTGVASWIGEKMDWAPAYIDHVANSYSGGMWKRWLSPAADNSLMTLTGLSTFRPRATARRDVNEFYEFAEDTRRKYNDGKASPEEVGRLRRAEKLKDELSEDFKEARNLNNAGLSTDERNKRREEIMFRVFRKIRDWDKAEVSDRDIGIRKAVDAISAKDIQATEKSTLDKNFSVIKGISLGELEYQLREYGREYVPDGKGKMRPRWTKDTIKKRVRNLYNAIQLMD